MKNRLIILGIVGFCLSLTATIVIVVEPNLAKLIKTNLTENLIEQSSTQNIDVEAQDEGSKEDNPNSQHAIFSNALLFAYQDNDEEAKNNFKKALETDGIIDPQKIQNFLDAYTTFESAKQGQRIYLDALLTKACIDAEKYEFAKKIATKVLNQKSDYRDVWILLGYANLKTESYAEAEDAFLKAKSIDSVKPEIHYFLGLARYMQENWQGAIEEFELGILYGFEPKQEAYKKIAESQTNLGAYEEALKAYEYLVSIDKSSVLLFEAPIKIAIYSVKDFDRALTLANTATTSFPNEPLGFTLTAEVYLAKNELESAENNANIAIDLNPLFAKAYYIKGVIKEAKGELDEAKKAYKSAYELSPQGDEISIKSAEKYNAIILTK